jgi:DNA-binding NarL/FixJ family response regulator
MPKSYLIRDFIQVISCRSLSEPARGEEGLETIEGLNPDVVLVDGSLPGMSGNDFVRKARLSKPSMKFISFSGRDEPESVRAALDAGACGYLVKGGQPDELLAAVRACLAGGCCVSPTVWGWEELCKLAGQTS